MSYNLILPTGYKPLLSVRDTERAIKLIKDFFEKNLAFELDLVRATAPLFVKGGTGINDDLNGIEQPASFAIDAMNGQRVEIVQSLAKWKRMMLADYGFAAGDGIYTDMNAIRPSEILDNIHSIYVDQWDWEKVITAEERNVAFLRHIVARIYDIIRRTEKFICHEYPALRPVLPDTIHFVHAEELEEQYPNKSPKAREYLACKEYGAIFIIGIGGPLKNAEFHDGRAPDYDDWITPTANGNKGLNGDIVVYNPVLESGYELSSMGIRVTPESLVKQIEMRNLSHRKELYFHKRLLNGELPNSIGGGIGQSRLCMFYLRKAHIGEIQASIWPEEMIATCKKNNIFLL